MLVLQHLVHEYLLIHKKHIHFTLSEVHKYKFTLTKISIQLTKQSNVLLQEINEIAKHLYKTQ